MSDLETTLKEIVVAVNPNFEEDGVTQAVTDILAAFKSAGWLKPDWKEGVAINVAVDGEGHLYKAMTGQEFYDRFERQYHMSADWIAGDETMGDDAEHDVLEAARKAAGLDD